MKHNFNDYLNLNRSLILFLNNDISQQSRCRMSAHTSANLLRPNLNSSDPHFLERSTNSRQFHQGSINFLEASQRRNESSRSKNAQESDDDPLLGDESESTASFGRSTMFYNQRQQLRTSLKNFFMTPFEKYTARGRVPWKLIFHVLKLLSLTMLLLLFGQDKFQLRTVLNAYTNNLGSLLIKDYSFDSDRTSELPGGPIVHRRFEIAESASHSLVNYFNLTRSAAGIFGFNKDNNNQTVLPDLCVTSFINTTVDVEQWQFSFDEKMSTNCLKVDCRNLTRLECKRLVVEMLPESYAGFISLKTTFQIRTIFLSVKARPKCVLLFASHMLRNEVMSGAIVSEFELTFEEVECSNSSTYTPQDGLIGIRESSGQIIIDCIVLVLSLITGFLVLKKMRATLKLYLETRNFYIFHYDRKLTWSETCSFISGWDFFNIVAEVVTITGIIFKINLDTNADSHLDITAVLIGSAVAINWIAALRFLSFDKGYYILVLTLSVATPNILRLMICILAIYVGYVLCGWVVFAPYTYKFASIGQTVDTLFAMINGDEILDSFMQVTGSSSLLSVFSKVYFYSFIVLFIYVVLSVMISLIGEAMIVAQSAVRTGMGHWLIEGDVFPELSLGWKHEESPEPPQQSGQDITAPQNRL